MSVFSLSPVSVFVEGAEPVDPATQEVAPNTHPRTLAMRVTPPDNQGHVITILLSHSCLLLDGEHPQHVAPGVARTQEGRVSRPALRGANQLNFSQSGIIIGVLKINLT